VAAACLSLDAADIAMHVHAPQVVSVGLPFLVVELRSRVRCGAQAQLRGACRTPAARWLGRNLRLLARARESAAAGSIVLHARTFSPLDGIIEDPATGSACAAAIALLATLDPRDRAELAWRIHQGVDMGRPSLLLGRTTKNQGAVTGTHIGGRCVAVLEGVLNLAS
jgi:trans-2,3-dihydro-3-hydroxyanthranilate isomerase